MRHTLFLLRHAEASPTPRGGTDFDRPLSNQGELDAILTARWLNEHHALPLTANSSPATRAHQTITALSTRRPSETLDLAFDERLYLANVQTLLEILAETSESINRLLLVGHNPGLTQLLHYLTPPNALSPDCQVMSPASIALISLDSNWCDLSQQCSSSCQLLFQN